MIAPSGGRAVEAAVLESARRSLQTRYHKGADPGTRGEVRSAR